MTRKGIPDAVLDELRARSADCADVAGWLGLRGHGRRWFCPSCQTRDSKTPDLSTMRKGGWRCHKCNAHGDAVALVALARGGSLAGAGFVEVALWLADACGLGDAARGNGLPRPVPPPSRATIDTPDEQRPAPALVDAAWVALCARQSPESPAARWMRRRGIPAALVRSGFACVDARFVDELASAPAASLRRVKGTMARSNATSARALPVTST